LSTNADALIITHLGVPKSIRREAFVSRVKIPRNCDSCTEEIAWAWVEDAVAAALTGDSMDRKLLPLVVQHWLLVLAQNARTF